MPLARNHRSASRPPRLSPLAALVAGLCASGLVPAQTADDDPRRSAAANDAVMPAVRATAAPETTTGKESLRTTTTTIGKGNQPLRDVPQSVTVITERLIDDRNLDTLKEALKHTSGVSFQAAEGAEEDIRLRGFSLQASGDIFIDGMRDPAFYERDSFNWDRLEVLRGSASMLFGRGSTGGAVNQVSKRPLLVDQNEVGLTLGSGQYLRTLADVNRRTGENAALRVNAVVTRADDYGVPLDNYGIAPSYRWGIGTRHEFSAGLYHLRNDNGIHYGLPWLAPGASGGSYLWKTDPRNYYGMASDYAKTGTTQGSFSHVFRFGDDAELRTALRIAEYERDQRASAIRFAPAARQPNGLAVNADTFGDATVLTRGTNNKLMNMDTRYVQSDYSGKHRWLGREHSVQAGVDLADEAFDNFAATVPPGVSLAKPTTTVGTPDDGARVSESLRAVTRNRTFEARALGVYAQDLLTIAPSWKLLGGLRWDRFEGTYRNIAIAANPNNPCAVTPATVIERDDSLLSQRLGLLYQPTPQQSWHLSYGTSFNTSGDTYQYDAGTADVDPEKSRNIELGGRIEAAGGRLSTRFALFHSTKYNERNRDADTVNACNYVLSGKRHAAGFEFDVAGRITPRWEVYVSYAFIPVARVDNSSGAPGTEPVGSRPGLTPKHTASLWSTYRLSPEWRVGGGLTARSHDKPVGLSATSQVEAPGFVSLDLMAEYVRGDFSFKLNLFNLADRHYADFLYRGHYVPGRPRTLQATLAYRF
ncbi:MAG: TonB-dependent siderophore receptor [Burkholderiaceae bacterium]|nr:TonB-dependent siderophore receptor [Burkholderiaceae bacterium]MEB2351227.1 TonB-dependent siderophore receptor [Burkholderiaceae bacterium]